MGEKSGVSCSDSPECAQLLLEYGANPNYQDEMGNTPLNIAWSTFGVNCIRLLLSFGADINLVNHYGTTPFLSSCYRGNYEWCEILYEYKELNPYVKTPYGYSPLELAIEVGKYRMLDWIIDQKINHGKVYPGMDMDEYDKIKLLHHAVNNPDNNANTVKNLWKYIIDYHPSEIEVGIISVFHRALLRKSKTWIEALIEFYDEHQLYEKVRLLNLNFYRLNLMSQF